MVWGIWLEREQQCRVEKQVEMRRRYEMRGNPVHTFITPATRTHSAGEGRGDLLHAPFELARAAESARHVFLLRWLRAGTLSAQEP